MNIIDIIQELLDYLHTHDGNRRTCDAMEECMERLQSELSKEEREREINRVGDTIHFLVEQQQKQNEEVAISQQEKQRFVEKIKRRVEECGHECRSMAKRKSVEQNHLVQIYENEFLTEMNVELNGKDMQEREKLIQIVDRSRLRLSDSIRTVVKEFTGSIIEEFNICMEKVRKAFAETQIKEFHKSYSDMYDSIMMNYDSMQRNIQAESDAYTYPEEPFREFSEKVAAKMEAVATKLRACSIGLKLLPLIIYLVKYIIDHYIIQHETWLDKVIALLERWMESVSPTEKYVYMIIEVILQFAQDNEDAFVFSLEFLLFFFFLGWLYYIYVKIVNRVINKSLYRKQQAIMAPAAREFLQNLKIMEEISNTLEAFERKIEMYYMQKHSSLFDSLVFGEIGTESESVLQKLQNSYVEYTKKY